MAEARAAVCSNVVITYVHLNKLKAFPRIGYRENKKLQGLGELLIELQCAKADGEYTGLRILDEPTHIKPVIAKLPGDVQRRWQQHVYRYPPFPEFATFIQELSLERNDTNLILELPEQKKQISAGPRPSRKDPRAQNPAQPRLREDQRHWTYVERSWRRQLTKTSIS